MEFRYPIFTEDDRVDCEINHPDYGWIPFTADPDDVEQFGRDLYAEIKARHEDPNDALVAEAYVSPPDVTPETINITEITKLQCKKQFVALGRWQEFKGLLQQDYDMSEDWHLASGLDVSDPMVQAIGAAMSLDVQQFFNEAGML